jgi:hypothetical protein
MAIPSGHAHPFDSTPHLPPAGIGEGIAGHQRGKGPSEGVMTMQPELYNPELPCPPHIKKWRKETEPGKTCLHPGVADDADHERIDVYGRAEPVGVKVHEVLNTAAKSYLIGKAVEKKESIYLSHKREPLGKPYVRGHELPADFASGTKGFGFPTPQDVTGDETKHLMHPTERVVPEDERQMYMKSHSNYDPGEQRHRGYSWVDQEGKIEPANYRFGGRCEKGEINGVGKTMNPALDENYKRPPVVVDKLLEDFRVVSTEGLGSVKNLGYGRTDAPDGHVYGMPSQGGPEWGVRECIGNYTPQEQQPDKDLGRSIRPGWRNIGPDNRVFGVPSIRSDISAPALKSVADHQNYGDEAGSATLLYPPRFADGGVTQADFLTATAKEELADIFRSAGFDLTDAQVHDTYERAKALDPNGLVSVQSFRMALNGEA